MGAARAGQRSGGGVILRDPAQGFDQEGVLALEDAGGEGFDGVAGLDGHAALGDNFAVVVLFVDEVDGDAGFFLPGVEDRFVDAVTVHALPAVFGQQGGVDVEDAPAVGGEDARAELFHVPGQDDPVGVVIGEGLEHGEVEGGGVGVGVGAEVDGGDGFLPGAGHGAGVAVVADHEAGYGEKIARFIGVDDGLHVAAVVRGEEGEVHKGGLLMGGFKLCVCHDRVGNMWVGLPEFQVRTRSLSALSIQLLR